jgi:hypothetical protein
LRDMCRLSVVANIFGGFIVPNFYHIMITALELPRSPEALNGFLSFFEWHNYCCIFSLRHFL